MSTPELLKLAICAQELVCPDCGASMRLRPSRYGPFYSCSKYPACKGSHGAHPDGRPLGVPTTTEGKRARIRAHDLFDQLWKQGGMSRSQAYAWLAAHLGLPKTKVHMGSFDIEQCDRVVAVVQAYLDSKREA